MAQTALRQRPRGGAGQGATLVTRCREQTAAGALGSPQTSQQRFDLGGCDRFWRLPGSETGHSVSPHWASCRLGCRLHDAGFATGLTAGSPPEAYAQRLREKAPRLPRFLWAVVSARANPARRQRQTSPFTGFCCREKRRTQVTKPQAAADPFHAGFMAAGFAAGLDQFLHQTSYRLTTELTGFHGLNMVQQF